MVKIVGVRTVNVGKSYYFDPGEDELTIGTDVIVETDRGVEFAKVSIPPIEVDDAKVEKPLRRITRIASEEDRERNRENRESGKEAYKICQEKIKVHGLEMKLIDSEYTFDRNKLLFYFTADGRVDFRELVKDLASIFRTRIELRQVGVRDETKILGGLGICGRELCCKAFLTDFAPVSIKMAKEQNLSLNPSKISGVCGRLMCCLNNEEATYEFLNKTMPKTGDFATTEDGEVGVIINVNILKQSVAVLFDSNDTKEVRDYRVEEIRFTPKRYGRPEEAPSVAQNRADKWTAKSGGQRTKEERIERKPDKKPDKNVEGLKTERPQKAKDDKKENGGSKGGSRASHKADFPEKRSKRQNGKEENPRAKRKQENRPEEGKEGKNKKPNNHGHNRGNRRGGRNRGNKGTPDGNRDDKS